MSSSLDMSNKVVLVTGGAKGVGAGITEVFLRAGADVEVCGRSTPGALPEYDGKLPTYSRVDVRDEQEVADWVAEVVGRHGHIDIVVNNAGGAPFANFADASPRFHMKVSDLNFMATAYVLLHAGRVMREQH